MKEHLILDLDGTLFFAEEKPGAAAIKGRRRNSYLAAETIRLLRKLQEFYDIVFATGRSLLSIKLICKMMEINGVYVKGVVVENGGLYQKEEEVTYLVSEKWMQEVKKQASHFSNIAQSEFTTCLALLRPTSSDVKQALDCFQAMDSKVNLLRDGNKMFFLAQNVNKHNALLHLLGKKQLAAALGAGNDINDLEWLQAVKKPAAPACAQEKVRQTVSAMNGIVAKNSGHEGIAEILTAFLR